jgi:hypothetical protein
MRPRETSFPRGEPAKRAMASGSRNGRLRASPCAAYGVVLTPAESKGFLARRTGERGGSAAQLRQKHRTINRPKLSVAGTICPRASRS